MSPRRRGSAAAGDGDVADEGTGRRGGRVRAGGAQGALLLGRVIDLITAVVCVLILIGILLVVFKANLHNGIAGTLHDWANTLTSPFHGLFTPKGAKARIALNWGIALAVYLVIGRILAAVARRLGGAASPAE